MRLPFPVLLLLAGCGGAVPAADAGCDYCFGNKGAHVSAGSENCPCPVDAHPLDSFVFPVDPPLDSCDAVRAKYLEWLVNVCARVP